MVWLDWVAQRLLLLNLVSFFLTTTKASHGKLNDHVGPGAIEAM